MEAVENEAGGAEGSVSAGTYPLLNSFEGSGDWAILPEGFAQVLGPLAAGLDLRLGDAGGCGAACWGVQQGRMRAGGRGLQGRRSA